MKPYFSVKRDRYAEIMVPGLYTLKVDVLKLRQQATATFVVPEMMVSRGQARQLQRAIDMALNFAEKAGADVKGGKGGRVPSEFNDGYWWFFADKQGSYKVAYDGRVYLPYTVCDAVRLRRIHKLVGEALAVEWKQMLSIRRLFGGWL